MNCEKCGKPIHPGTSFCENCGHAHEMQPVPEINETPTPAVNDAPAQKPENLVAGIVGAIIGAALGGGAIILLSQLGYVASISGLILAVCTLKGYELLGGRLSTKGIVISIVLMLVTPYIADRLDWAILIMQEFADLNVTFGQAFAAVPELIAEGAIEKSSYITNLLMIYGFAALGAVSTLWNLFKKRK